MSDPGILRADRSLTAAEAMRLREKWLAAFDWRVGPSPAFGFPVVEAIDLAHVFPLITGHSEVEVRR